MILLAQCSTILEIEREINLTPSGIKPNKLKKNGRYMSYLVEHKYYLVEAEKS